MAPREANNPYPDQYLTIEYDATAIMMPHDTGPAADNDGIGGAVGPIGTVGDTTGEGNLDLNLDMEPPVISNDVNGEDEGNSNNNNNITGNGETEIEGDNNQVTNLNVNIAVEETSVTLSIDDQEEEEEEEEEEDDQSNEEESEDANMTTPQPPAEVHLPITHPLPMNLSGETTMTRLRNANNQGNNVNNNNNNNQQQHQSRRMWNIMHRNNNARPGMHYAPSGVTVGRGQFHRSRSGDSIHGHADVDPLAIDMSDPDEEDSWNDTHAMLAEAAMMASSSNTSADNNNRSNVVSHNLSFDMSIPENIALNRPANGGRYSRNQTLIRAARTPRQVSISSVESTGSRRRPHTADAASYHRGSLVTPTPGDASNNSNIPSSHQGGLSGMNRTTSRRRRNYHNVTRRSLSLSSVLDQDPSISDDEQDDNANVTSASTSASTTPNPVAKPTENGLPDLDTTVDASIATSETSSAPNTPQAHITWDLAGEAVESQNAPEPAANANAATSTTGSEPASSTASSIVNRFTLSPVRRLIRGERNLFHQSSSSNNTINIVTDEDNVVTPTSYNLDDLAESSVDLNFVDLPLPPSPRRFASGSSSILSGPGPNPGSASSRLRSVSNTSTNSGRSIRWTTAFESGIISESSSTLGHLTSEQQLSATELAQAVQAQAAQGIETQTKSQDTQTSINSEPSNSNQINFSFGANTNVSDLKYFAERGCIVHLLCALDTPRLKTVGTRMLADYAKIPHRRVAVASNKRSLEFCCRTMLELPSEDHMGTEWPAREYAVETIRSLTATEDSDAYLMGCTGLLKALAIVVRGGPFYDSSNGMYRCNTAVNRGSVSGKARLHACIAIMNLSCGKANKIEIASIPEVLEAMRDVMLANPEQFSPTTSSPPVPNSSSSTATPKSVAEEARLKAATCIKNLSNADANDAALLGADSLIQALAHAAVVTCSPGKGATHCTTNACLALMNLSISKANKHIVFKTPGVMDALMTVLARTSPSASNSNPSTNTEQKRSRGNSNSEARVKACSALSNLAIGYENKIPMFLYDGFVDCILQVIATDTGEARTKACSILWSFAAEMKNQVPVVQRGDILPTLVRVAEEDHSTEARFKCVAALTLLAESLENAIPLLESGALHPLMDILHEAGADPTQWKGQTASWCVGFLMNMAQSDDAAPFLRDAGVVELLAPLLTLDHYQSLKAAMAVTFICRFDKDDETYDLLRKTENVIPKIISLLHNTLSGRGGNGYKYGVFTLRSSVGCISSLASGPEFMKERIATKPVFESLLQVISDFCVDSGTKGAIVGGGHDDTMSAILAIRALQSLIEYMIPIPGSSALPFGIIMDKRLIVALESFESCPQSEITVETRELARDGLHRINKSLGLDQCAEDNDSGSEGFIPRTNVANNIIENSIVASLVQGCCIGPSLHGNDEGFFPSMIRRPTAQQASPAADVSDVSDGNESACSSTGSQEGIGTFLLTDSRTGRLFAVPKDPSGGRAFNDRRRWCYRRGRYCRSGEIPDPNFVWTDEMQAAYSEVLQSRSQTSGESQRSSMHGNQQSITPAILK